MRALLATSLLLFSIAAFASPLGAQDPVPYGEAISLETAKKVMEGAEQKAKEENWPVAIAIVDSGGHLVHFHRLEKTQLGSIEIAIQKAKTAVMYRRPTKAFQDMLAQGGENLRLLQIPGMLLEGGLPIIHEGKLIGGIGVSGVRSDQDAEVGQAGLDKLE